MTVPAEPPDGMTLRGDLGPGLDRDQRIVVCLAETQKLIRRFRSAAAVSAQGW
jgi:hypothetical protein